MNYQLHRGGQNLGTFSLEELRRKRAAGELIGTEYVWREGMSDWEVLDSVLRQHSPPPPIPSSLQIVDPARRKRNTVLIWAALAALFLIFVGGMAGLVWFTVKTIERPPVFQSESMDEDGLEVASRPIVAGSNTLIDADVQKRAKAFRVRQWLEGYRERGDRDQPCDGDALKLIESWIAYNYDGQAATNMLDPRPLADKLAAQPGCGDPLLLTATAAISIEMIEATRRLERALDGYPQSKHRAYPKFYATVILANNLSDQPARVAVLDASALGLLKEAFADGSFLPDDEAEIAEIFINGWGDSFFRRHGEAITALANNAGRSFEWLAKVLLGEHHINLAWKARGGGYSDSVSQKGWRGFSEHLAKAREYLTAAWESHTNRPLAAHKMMSVALGESGAEEMRLWFDRAVAAQIDHPGAWTSMRWGLRPRWHGSMEAMQAFGVRALDTGRFDTDVPRRFFDVVTDLEGELEVGPGEHIYGRKDIWPNLQRMYEGYIAEPSQASMRDGWRSTYVIVSFLAGKYDVARANLEALDWQIWSNNLTRWGVELSLLPLEVAARTGPAGRGVAKAESTRRRGNIGEALKLYKAQELAESADERTAQFVRHRTASLEVEQKLAEGQWVDWLPATQDDPNWVVIRGKHQRLAEALEIHAGTDGHFLFSRARIGPDLEVKGQFEVVRSSNKDFQAGLIMGLPDWADQQWYGFRMKRNSAEGQIVAFARGWTRQQIYKPISLNDGQNSFHFRFHKGRVSATVNGKEVFREAKPPRNIQVAEGEFLLGLGAFNDVNETVVRYRNVQVRRAVEGN